MWVKWNAQSNTRKSYRDGRLDRSSIAGHIYDAVHKIQLENLQLLRNVNSQHELGVYE